MIYALEGHTPMLDPDGTAWVAPDANVIGKVVLESQSSVWFCSTLRGDNEEIRVGAGSNVQENCVLHTDIGSPLVIGRDCTIGHKVMLHGCIIGDNSLIGMGAIVLDGAKIGANCLIGAGALVTGSMDIPDNSMVLGSPGKIVRAVDQDTIRKIAESAEMYRANAARFKAGLTLLEDGR